MPQKKKVKKLRDQPYQEKPEFDSYDKTAGVKSASGSNRTGGVQEVGSIQSANWPGPNSWRLTPLGIELADGTIVPIPDGSITNAKLASMSQALIKGRAAGAGSGVVTDLTATQVKAILAILHSDISDFYSSMPGANRFAAYGAGTAYSLTASFAQLALGSTAPAISITTPGTYMLLARVRTDYNGATFAANRTVSYKIRRTNNTAGDVANSAAAFLTEIVTTDGGTAEVMNLPVCIYTTANSNDALEIQGKVSTVPTAGSIDAVECELVAIRIV